MKKIILIALLAIFGLNASSQEKFTLSGYIKDAKNGETLIGATVFVTEINGGNVSNVYGFYSITLPKGEYKVNWSFIGYETITETIVLTENLRRDVNLKDQSKELETIVISAEREDANVTSMEMSTVGLDIKSITKIPAFAGEVDIIKSLQLLPGVSTVGEGASGFNVRGGEVGQNLILLDEAPVYQSSHLFGFFSVFNPDAVKDVKLYKGGIPANYGGRLSSILDIRMKEGNNQNFDLSGGVGTVFSRIAVEGPIIKEKASFIVAARRSYIDVLVRPFTDVLDNGAALYFYDMTAKANYTINPKNRVFVSGYFGRDVFRFDAQQGFNWGNQTATIRWNHLFSDRFFSNFTAFYSNYDYAFGFGENDQDSFNWDSRIKTYNFKSEFSWFINTNNELRFGGEILAYNFEPANAVGVSSGEVTNISLDNKRAIETALFISNDQKLTNKISLQYGLRFSGFAYQGAGTAFTYEETIPGVRKNLVDSTVFGQGETIANYGNLEPRASVKYELNPTSSIKASYNRMNQYIHLISNTTAATPIDVWQPSTNNLKPQQGNQVALGYFRNFSENLFETSAEVYYKWNRNQLDYIDGADIFINKFLEADLLSGIGRAYGLELYVKKNRGRLNGWMSYTLGKTEMKVDGINFDNDETRAGNWYPTRFDQRHNIKMTTNYQLTRRMSIGGIFTYISGTPTTFPTDRYIVQGYVIPLTDNSRNNIRIPDYHRLDLSLTIDNVIFGKKNRIGNDYLVISIYNVYARENPFSIYFSQGQDRQSPGVPIETFGRQVAILGTMLPAIAYNFNF